jgi:hypothetical protein
VPLCCRRGDVLTYTATGCRISITNSSGWAHTQQSKLELSITISATAYSATTVTYEELHILVQGNALAYLTSNRNDAN